MADTKHVHDAPPVEGDGVSYSGIVWFVVILTATTVFCQLLVWGAFELMEWRVDRIEPERAPLAAARNMPGIEAGGVVTGQPDSPRPTLLVNEPLALRNFRNAEAGNAPYGWVDQSAGRGRVPIDRAKALLLERGLPTRPGAGPATTPASPGPAVVKAPPADTAPGKPAGGH
jgi:hypothetical protein